jgi:hypothetical protein
VVSNRQSQTCQPLIDENYKGLGRKSQENHKTISAQYFLQHDREKWEA